MKSNLTSLFFPGTFMLMLVILYCIHIIQSWLLLLKLLLVSLMVLNLLLFYGEIVYCFTRKIMTSHCSATQMNFKFTNSKIAPNPLPKMTTVTIVFRILSQSFKIYFKVWIKNITQIPIFRNPSQRCTVQKHESTCEQGYSWKHHL